MWKSLGKHFGTLNCPMLRVNRHTGRRLWPKAKRTERTRLLLEFSITCHFRHIKSMRQNRKSLRRQLRADLHDMKTDRSYVFARRVEITFRERLMLATSLSIGGPWKVAPKAIPVDLSAAAEACHPY